MGQLRLVDGFGRVHTDLRVSLTDRCSLRCTYCMPAEGLPWLPGTQMLTKSELLRIVSVSVAAGIDSVRLTGGEPLLRPDVVDIVAGIARMGVEVSMTTNGLRLPGLAAPLRDAGLQRVNISLDTLDRQTFRAMTHRDRLVDTLAGIRAAQIAGLDPVKINTVLLRGVNDSEAPGLLRWAIGEGLHLRFIEQMPLDPQHGWRREEMVKADEIMESLSGAGFHLTAVDDPGPAPARRWDVNGGLAQVGIVASVTRPFCGTCNRLRLTADGQWRNCLFAHGETDLRTALRDGASDDRLAELMAEGVAGKLPGHGIDDPSFLQPPRPMSAIGG
ncbi:MAG: GTP 3',8-cyclase MoaA [Candidatus Nanopelagicales bacterium]